MESEFSETFDAWIGRLELLATEGGIEIPLDLSQFEPQYRDGQTPIEALEHYATRHTHF